METDEKLLSAIFNVGRLVREEIHASHCLKDFSYTEIEILKYLQDRKNTTMKAIADYLYIKPSSATPVVGSLFKKGDIKRIYSEKDRRMVYIELTTKGIKSLQEMQKNKHTTIEKIFGKLKVIEEAGRKSGKGRRDASGAY